MKRLVVYTVQTGANDDFDGFGLDQSEHFDLVLFSDKEIEDARCRTITFDTHALEPARSSRIPKLLPHKFLGDYEWSLYIDANAKLKKDPTQLVDEYASGSCNVYSFKNPDWSCLYDAAEAAILEGFDDERRVREQMDLYRKLGYPKGSGLNAATCLLRRHMCEDVIGAGEEWYDHVLRFSKRDQISFNFVAWRRRLKHASLRGELRDNAYVDWPRRHKNERLTPDFDPEIYTWLNSNPIVIGSDPAEHFLEQRRKGKKEIHKLHNWTLRKIANAERTDKGNIYFNSHGYADVYEAFLKPLRDKPVRLLELGLLRHDVQARNPGGPYDETPSLAMWRKWLPEAVIFGFDIADFSAAPTLPGVSILRGDMGNKSDLKRLVDETGGNFDIIIDDASHASHHQQIALSYLFEHLKPGGLYFIEDLHYQPRVLEKAGNVKTRYILGNLAEGRIRSSKFISAATLRRIRSRLDWVQTYDSQDRNFGKLHRDALAVLRKKGQNGSVASRGAIRFVWNFFMGKAAAQ